ncbi:MAG: phosphatidylglycerol lysyltransferase domain-containing protein [Candidatus Saccharimonadales bacterium]
MIFFSRIINKKFILRLVAFGVFANGFMIVASTLLEQIFSHERNGLSTLLTSLPLLMGLTLTYLATLLKRRKHTAWMVVLPVYGAILLINIINVAMFSGHRHATPLGFVSNFLLPLIVVFGLVHYRHDFNVKSDTRSFKLAARTSLLVLVVALAYGTAGFQLMDMHDFHQEISLGSAMHYTADQFEITTDKNPVPHTRRARLFIDSLSVISTGAFLYVFVSLFQPLKARLYDQTYSRTEMRRLLREYPSTGEDYFKTWPHDKLYYFNLYHTAGLAYHVHRGIALTVGDPAGDINKVPELLKGFSELCRVNDWLPAIIHSSPEYNGLYEKGGYSLQKIGEEAVIDISNFQSTTRHNKYFRQITNRFTKQNYTTELLSPPHSKAVIARLREVSDDWLSLPGRAERGFMMGYFSEEYMQRCSVLVLKDDAGTIQAFINQITSDKGSEANFDLLRHTKKAPTNSNDYLLLKFIDHIAAEDWTHLTLGLCPLAGLDNSDMERTLIDNTLRFVYANGDRFYSFSGLHRFKSKYNPSWSSRYIAYKGGIRGFTRTLTSLNKVMNKTN